jgi:aspartyl-tRNA(Asn)/glutamyl-tRNA(Gln) amidotransferase subunit A
MSALHQLTLAEAARRMRAREFSSLDLVEALVRRITDTDHQVGAYLSVDVDAAREQARAADAARAPAGTRRCWACPSA